MNIHIDSLANGSMDTQTDYWTDEQPAIQADKWNANRLSYRQMDKWTEGQTDRQMDKWTVRQTNGKMDSQTNRL
jgi:hypothetical protein